MTIVSNKVSLDEVQTSKSLVRGTYYEDRDNREIFHAVVTDDGLRLVGLEDGNIWDSTSEIPDDFNIIVPGRVITITVGEGS